MSNKLTQDEARQIVSVMTRVFSIIFTGINTIIEQTKGEGFDTDDFRAVMLEAFDKDNPEYDSMVNFCDLFDDVAGVYTKMQDGPWLQSVFAQEISTDTPVVD